MSGIRVERSVKDGKTIWTVINLDTNKVVATGATINEAVNQIEVVEENDCS